ncbi:hypothetical protein HAX54_050475 [Datura stramonium]|uniref:Leucine-rich repeat-containing N-terminal plant-type domain-containing protein n=1 Tax=Datura stramonium TaxID=4076 RepID=A0ABS8SWJ0_DATST|nr:hypothetical protein [Datura stramonium]
MGTLHFLWLFLILLLQILSGNELFLVSSQRLEDQKSLLLQLQGSLQYNSSLSTKLARWNQNTSDCCNWEVVTCDSSGHVIVLELDNETISSGIENSIALFSLQYLENLNLAYNMFNVGIPTGIYNLANLKYLLNLSNAGFVGQISMTLSRLRRLVTLALSTLFPDVIHPLKLENPNLRHVIENLTELRELYLDGVDLSAQRRDWCQSLSSYLPNLKVLSLCYTNFSGSLPESISNLQNLSKLELSNCSFSGPIPSTIANLTELVYLDISFNSFTGSIPYLQQFKKLAYLDFSENHLTGLLSPAHFKGLLELAYINLAVNYLTGIRPAYMFELPSLEKLFLFNNQFAGQVKEFRNASPSLLDTIDLSNNNLNGSIPESIFGIESLKLIELGLASCRLQKFPDLKSQSRMTVLDLSDNQIHGPIPSWIWKIGDGAMEYLEQPYNVSSTLVILDLHSNKLKGELPIQPFWSIPYLDCSRNNFNNSIPLNINNSLGAFFSFANNRLTGRIPESICNASYLQVLDFSNNALSGKIPPCLLEYSKNLGVLNLENNSLYGIIPHSFPIGCSLQTLDLSENKLQRRMPKSLVNCELLEVLNVGNNRLVDSFPFMLKNSSGLRVLVFVGLVEA